MKKLLFFVPVMACLVVRSQNTNVITTTQNTNTVSTLVDTNTIMRLGASGQICTVYGHNWRDGRPGEGPGGYYADYHPNTSYRTCKVCGICQSQDLTWR